MNVVLNLVRLYNALLSNRITNLQIYQYSLMQVDIWQLLDLQFRKDKRIPPPPRSFFSINLHILYRHLIGFFLFLSLTIYTATKVPKVVDLHTLQQFPDVLKKADLHKLHSELMTCLPSLPNMPDLHRLREELKTTLHSMDYLPSLSGWHIRELLYNCLPERFSSGNYTDVCVLVMLFP